MADRRRTSQTQMADLNAQLNDQNNTLRAMLKVGNETEQITNNVQGQLNRQRGVLEDNLYKNRQIAQGVKQADKKTRQMRRRNMCIKAGLYLLIILLFAANIGLIIWKVQK